MTPEERAVARLEAAEPRELVEYLRQPSPEEERALRTYLGDERYRHMRALALRTSATRGEAGVLGNVVVLHGIMGSELSVVEHGQAPTRVWIRLWSLARGHIDRLRLDEDGLKHPDPRWDVHATAILKRYYGELILALSARWRVRAFWYDWRKDLDVAAAALESRLRHWFPEDEPVHLVAHSMGGLVARTFVKNYPERWKRMGAGSGAGGRLVMLGTPNHGSFDILRVLAGLESNLRKLALVDLRHDLGEVSRIVNSFPGVYQMLPSPLAKPEVGPLYDEATWRGLGVRQELLDQARRHHEGLAGAVDGDRMLYVAGTDRPTYAGLDPLTDVTSPDAYQVTRAGDGRVTHQLGLLDKVPTWYVEADHGDLARSPAVLATLDELLQTGTLDPRTGGLGRVPVVRTVRSVDAEREDLAREEEAELASLRLHLRRARSRSGDGPDAEIGEAHREVEEALVRGVLSAHAGGEQRGVDARTAGPPPVVEIALVHGSIDRPELGDRAGRPPVDALAVGHYEGVQPQGPERVLDVAISRALGHSARGANGASLISDFAERGVLHGGLGKLFVLPDPGLPKGRGRPDRIVCFPGMGVPGQFGTPELVVLARELAWSLGRMGRRHLWTVLIGSGNGNLDVPEATASWLEGLAQALTGAGDEASRLQHVTFVEWDPRRVARIQEAIQEESERLRERGRLEVRYTPVDLSEVKKAVPAFERRLEKRIAEREARRDHAEMRDGAPVRLSVRLDRDGIYRFGALTPDAAVPEREVTVDPALVAEAATRIAAERHPGRQEEQGRYLERLLLPAEFREHLRGREPVVLLVDATTARIPWEMIAQPDPFSSPTAGARSAGRPASFLGTTRGFTRQLRTPFAPPPGPPPPALRTLRVLIVADPAEDARLAGAEREGVELAELFEAFNRIGDGGPESDRVEVELLLGPSEATRNDVLQRLITRRYDILHFAGHCVYDEARPENSGWVFSGGRVLRAAELSRVDRVPEFVFSNACESGRTPERPEDRSAALAPAFAEAFFARGVANFVCTAWPVDDIAARAFARTLYAHLFGIDVEGHDPDELALGDGGNGTTRYTAGTRRPMVLAMRAARERVARMGVGLRTWGAYQHYGNPYFRLFRPRGEPSSADHE